MAVSPDKVKEYIEGWNNAGRIVNADLLEPIFKIQQGLSDMANHNLIVGILNIRLGAKRLEFLDRVADLIEELSLRNLADDTQNTETG